MDFQTSECALGVSINSLFSRGQKSKSMIRIIKKGLNNKMDVIILKLCMIVAEGNSGLPFPSREGSEKALKHTMTSKRKT